MRQPGFGVNEYSVLALMNISVLTLINIRFQTFMYVMK